MTSSVAGPRRSSRTLPKAKLASKKGHSHCSVIRCHLIHFLNMAKPSYLRSMLSKSMICTKNCNTYSWYWSTERAQCFTSHNQCFKNWTNRGMKFCLIHHNHLTFHQQTTTSSSISTTFFRENTSTASRRQKMFSKESLKHGFLCYRNKQTYFSLAKMCWL